MHSTLPMKTLALLTLAALTTAHHPPKPPKDCAPPPNPPTFNTTYLFTAHILIGLPPPGSTDTNPITIPGGIIVPEPILGGTVSGPYINATITGGLATPRVYGQVQQPVIDLYGATDDGMPLVIRETGIGRPEAQVTRLEVSIGGGERFEVIRDGFIIATVNPNAARDEVTVQGYLVENTVAA